MKLNIFYQLNKIAKKLRYYKPLNLKYFQECDNTKNT